MAATMKAIAQMTEGGPEVLSAMEIPRPVPKTRELLVRVYASSVNPTCVKQRGQKLPFTPFVLGRDGAGTVVEVGPDCTKFKVGDHVYFSGDRRTNGTNAEYTVVAEYICGRKPNALDWGEAAAMPLVTLTAWEAMFEIMKLQPSTGGSMLITAGAGGVGSIAIQVAANVLGLTVIATASRVETQAFCKEKGAHHVVNHRHDVRAELQRLGVPKVDYVLNLADWGNEELAVWADCIKPLGHIVSILPPKTSLEAATMAKLFFLRAKFSMELMWVRTLTDTEPEKQGDILDSASKLFDLGTLNHTLMKALPFTAEGLVLGHNLSDSGTCIGKMCLVDAEAPSLATTLRRAKASEGTMLAYASDGKGGFDMQKLERPRPTGLDILVRNLAISMNPVDSKAGNDAMGKHPAGTVLGFDSVGIVEAVGDRCTLFRAGDRVWFAGELFRAGTNAEYTVVDERIVSLAPTKLSDAQAASVPLVGLTAWEGLTEKLRLSTPAAIGKTILVLPGGGGVGSIVIQLAKKLLNMVVIATASRPESIEWCQKMGANHVVDHNKPLKAQLETLGLAGVDYIFNCYDTAANFDQYCEIIKPMGGIVSIVETRGTPLDVGKLMMKRVTFSWELMFQRCINGNEADRIVQHQILSKLSYLYDSGVLQSVMSRQLKVSMNGLTEARSIQDNKRAIGKTSLVW